MVKNKRGETGKFFSVCSHHLKIERINFLFPLISKGLAPKSYVHPLTNDEKQKLERTKFDSIKEKDEILKKKPWYYGSISREKCDQLLNEFGEPGDFLVRDSQTKSGDYSVSLQASDKNKHFRVLFKDGVFCIGQRKFVSLDELIEHYKKAPIYTDENGEKLYLIKPFSRS